MTITLETPSGTHEHDGHFPDRLRRQRTLLSLTQKQLAKKSRLKRTGYRSIEDWENARSTPRIGGPIVRVAKTLGVSVAWLMYGEEARSE